MTETTDRPPLQWLNAFSRSMTLYWPIPAVHALVQLRRRQRMAARGSR